MTKRATQALAAAGYSTNNQTALVLLVEFAAQNPGLDFANYGDLKPYRADSRQIGRDWNRFKAALKEAAYLNGTDQDVIQAAPHAFSGRLEWKTPTWWETGKAQPLQWHYCTGQYFPTEYRKAAASVLEAACNAKRRQAPNMPTEPATPTIEAMKEGNRAAGVHFFDEDTMRFFRSRIESKPRSYNGLWYFIDSSQFVPSSGIPDRRKYSLSSYNPKTGDVDRIGDFQKYTSKGEATKALREHLSPTTGKEQAA